MRFFLPIVFLLFSVNMTAQEAETDNAQTANKVESPHDGAEVSKNTLEEVQGEDDVDFVNKVSRQVILKDSVVFQLLDHHDAGLIDSLWQKELFKSSLYRDVKKDILDQEYIEVVNKDLPTDTLKARLEKINAKTPFKVEYNPLLENVINSYLKRHKKSMENLMALSTYYFPMFEQELDKHNIPLEIKYLAIVESSLNPRARSRVGATGLWQFMFATGKMHGLDVSSYVDERMDPVLATDAAAKYLSTLYRVFEDWDLVLASYNSGPGNVSKAIRRSGGSKDYWELRPYLPRETAGYVPAFLAVMYIFEYAEEHDFQIPSPRITYYETDTIRTKRMLTFDQISDITGVESEMLQFLNPSYKLDIIPHITDENYTLRLPRDKAGIFVSNEESIYEYAETELAAKKKELPEFVETESSIRYRVKSGDFLGKIAEMYGVSVTSIKRWNNLRSNNLRIGQRLTIHPRRTPAVASSSSKGSGVYIVKKGDTLWSIANKHKNVSVQKLKELNNLKNTRLKPGMKLKVSEG